MTAPPWATAALQIDGLDVGAPPLQLGSVNEENVIPESTYNPSETTPVNNPRWIDSDGKPSLVYTSTSKEGELAYTVCPKCPEPRRNQTWLMPYFPEINKQRGYRYVRRYTKRCKECNTTITRRMRAKRLLSDIQMTEKHLDLGVRWVTLTAPNYPCRDRGLKDFKKKVKRFRDRNEYRSKVVGGAEFYEWTVHPDDRAWSNPICWNVHLHALWIGDYWPQKDLLRSWGNGGARIEDARTTSKRCLNYVISYAKKQQSSGIRAQNRTGCLYGRAFAELKSAAMLLAELDSADDVLE